MSPLAERLRAMVGEARLQSLLGAYDDPRGAVLPLVVLLRDTGIEMDAEVTTWIAQVCETSATLVDSAISAYPELDTGQASITVCDGLTCRLMGGGAVQRLLRERLGATRVGVSACQNACSSAPVLQVRGALYGALHEEALAALTQRLETRQEGE